MKKLYSITDTTDINKQDLYIKKIGKNLDFFTYFNCFSIKKWKEYTTIETVALKLAVHGKWKIIWLTADDSGIHNYSEEIIDRNSYEHMFAIDSLQGVLLGFQLQPLDKEAVFLSGAWYGSFAQWEEKKIGISITTFKREMYVKKNMALLQKFQEVNPWLSVLVVDNGHTLPVQDKERFELIHNLNFGGSGGFTRGLIEYVNAETVDYVLLMDDDVQIEVSALERTYALICALKEKFVDSFLSGAMLQIEKPGVQFENTAYWHKVRLYAWGRGFDLSQLEVLVKNEQINNWENTYGAWWYCCMPIKRIKEIGYPLPVFIKGDDMEYGIRNHRPWIHMNGIGVWHQSFANKQNHIVEYFNDRNMMILEHFAEGCNRFTFFVLIMSRFARHIVKRHAESIRMYEKVLQDYALGFEHITSIGADEKLKEVQSYDNKKWLPFSILCSLGKGVMEVILYSKRHKQYRDFQKNQLKTQKFWRKYLKI